MKLPSGPQRQMPTPKEWESWKIAASRLHLTEPFGGGSHEK